MKIEWAALEELSLITPPRIVSLNPMSQVLVEAALSFLSPRHNWRGTGYQLTDSEWDDIAAAVDKLSEEVSADMLIGSIIPYAGALNPTGTLPCDGSSHLRADYPLLYDYLAATPLIVDADNFTTPFFDNRVVVAAGDAYAPYDEFGEDAHSLTEDENAPHTHDYTPPVANVDLETPGAPDIFAAGVGSVQVATTSSGLGNAHENRQPSIAFGFCIVSGRPLGV